MAETYEIIREIRELIDELSMPTNRSMMEIINEIARKVSLLESRVSA